MEYVRLWNELLNSIASNELRNTVFNNVNQDKYAT